MGETPFTGFWGMVFTRFWDSHSHSGTERPDYRMPPPPFFNVGGDTNVLNVWVSSSNQSACACQVSTTGILYVSEQLHINSVYQPNQFICRSSVSAQKWHKAKQKSHVCCEREYFPLSSVRRRAVWLDQVEGCPLWPPTSPSLWWCCQPTFPWPQWCR